MNMISRTTCLGAVVAAALSVFAVNDDAGAVRFAAPFGDGMVLQRGMPVAVWGRVPTGEEVSVSFAGNTVKAVADAKGVDRPRRARYLHEKDSRTNVYSDVCLPLLAFEVEVAD